eukprot:1659742-Prymnesium_polylepis.1
MPQKAGAVGGARPRGVVWPAARRWRRRFEVGVSLTVMGSSRRAWPSLLGSRSRRPAAVAAAAAAAAAACP